MTQFEQQVIANTQMLQQILESSQNYSQFDPIPGGLQETDILSVLRLDGQGSVIDTFQIPVSELLGNASSVTWKYKYVGVIADNLGNDTTNQQIQDKINEVGFTVAQGELVIIVGFIRMAGELRKASYFYIPNSPGTYGNAGTPIFTYELYRFELSELTTQSIGTTDFVTIELGDIGASTIEDYINATTQQPEWDLDANSIYAFKCIINNSRFAYIYTGPQPRHLGQEDANPALASEFELIDNGGWYFAEGCWVQKDGNLETTIIEVGDIVYFKKIEYNGRKMMMVGWQYLGGDKTDYNNYEKVYGIM
jgi:hypothetical protein